MVGAAEELLHLLPWVNQDSPNLVAGKQGKGSRDIHLGAPFKQDQRLSGAVLQEQISTVALEWGWGIALLALGLPPGFVTYPMVALQGPVCVSSATSACREALLCFPLWFYSGWWWIPFY